MTETVRTRVKSIIPEQRPIEDEHSTEREIIIPRFDVLVFVGESGLFKTTVAEMMAGVNDDPRNLEAQTKFHLDGVSGPVKVGQLIRAETEARTGQPFIENFGVKIEDDRRYDDGMRQLMAEIRKPRLVVSAEGMNQELREAAIIVEGRFQGFIGAAIAEMMAGRKYAPRIERVLFYSNDDEERRRIEITRELASGASHLTPEELAKLGTDRELELSEKAQLLFPELVHGQYIFDPDMKTREGQDVHTIKIDARGKTPSELAKELYKCLEKRNALFIINRNNFADTPEGESAFRIIKSLQRCQGLLEDNSCNRYGIRTVDIYADNELLVQISACSSDHARNIQLRITKESEDAFTYSKNGLPVNKQDVTN